MLHVFVVMIAAVGVALCRDGDAHWVGDMQGVVGVPSARRIARSNSAAHVLDGARHNAAA